MRALRRLIAACLPLLLLGCCIPVLAHSSAQDRLSTLQSQMDHTRSRLTQKQGTEHVLTTQVSAWNSKINALQASITRLERRRDAIQSDLDHKQAQLAHTQAHLRSVRARLQRLRAKLDHGRDVLARRLVDLYESDRPDIVTVVLSSHGFADLLDRGDFLRRIGEANQRVIDAVMAAKRQASTLAGRLSKLESSQQHVAGLIEERRNAVARVQDQLVSRRSGYARVRARKRAALGSVQAQAAKLKGHLDALQAASNKVKAQLQAAQPASSSVAGPPGPASSAGLIWPVNGPITSPFCESRAWESCHPGIDIGVPSGTPIHAAAAGTVVLMQDTASSGGYGNFTCIQHTATMSTCYAHQERFATSVGAHVAQGQVIGYTDCTGLCFGPHLHFEVRINGSVVNPIDYLP